MKIMILSVLLLGGFIVVRGQTTKPLQENNRIDNKQEQTKCGRVVKGFQLCIPAPVITLKTGESAPLHLILKNVSAKTTIVIKANFDAIYNVNLRDANGSKVLSKNEILAEKINKKSVKDDCELPLNSAPQKIPLEPQQELKLVYNFTDFYDLTSPGKYLLEVTRIVSDISGDGVATVSLGGIKIEVLK